MKNELYERCCAGVYFMSRHSWCVCVFVSARYTKVSESVSAERSAQSRFVPLHPKHKLPPTSPHRRPRTPPTPLLRLAKPFHFTPPSSPSPLSAAAALSPANSGNPAAQSHALLASHELIAWLAACAGAGRRLPGCALGRRFPGGRKRLVWLKRGGGEAGDVRSQV